MAMMQKLNLTDEQQAQMRKIHVDFQRKQIQNESKIRLGRLDLAQMLQADKPDRSAIEKAIRDISSIQTDTKLARVDQMIAIRNILTADQQKLWKQQMMNRRGMMRGRMGMPRRESLGLLGENMSLPEVDLTELESVPDPMDPSDLMMDDVEVGNLTTP